MLKKHSSFQVYPHYLLLLGKEPTSEDMDKGKYGITFDIMPFKPQKYGQSNRFLALTKFFFTANEDYREVGASRQQICTRKIQDSRHFCCA